MNTLRRYKRHYKVQAKPGLNKAQLVDVSKIIIIIFFTNIFQGYALI